MGGLLAVSVFAYRHERMVKYESLAESFQSIFLGVALFGVGTL